MAKQGNDSSAAVQPVCPYFGTCGGCAYQHLSYRQELQVKQEHLQTILDEIAPEIEAQPEKIVPSPKEYHYRHRLDMRLLKTRAQKIFVGFSPQERFGVVDVEQCAIAMEPVSAFIPDLKIQAQERLPQKYRLANLVVRCGDEGRVQWGGIGKRSLQQEEADYFWTQVNGLKVYYALDTFFQANLSILPQLLQTIRQLPLWAAQPAFLDLYGGVGLFSLGLLGAYRRAWLIEDSKNSVRLAHYNVRVHDLSQIDVIEGRVEDQLDIILQDIDVPVVAMIDPPRAGLSTEARHVLCETSKVNDLLYLSCQPEALARDLRELMAAGWRVVKIIPFDFFPKTRHLETLVWLTSVGRE